MFIESKNLIIRLFESYHINYFLTFNDVLIADQCPIIFSTRTVVFGSDLVLEPKSEACHKRTNIVGRHCRFEFRLSEFAFTALNALTLLVGRQEEYPACKY